MTPYERLELHPDDDPEPLTRPKRLGFFAWLFRDRRDDDSDRPDWQALVDAVDLAADIASPRFDSKRTAHVVQHRVTAQTLADFYYSSSLREAVDGELFALEAALATYPDDFLGRQDAVRRYDYILRWPRPRTPIGRWALVLAVALVAAIVVLLIVAIAAPTNAPAGPAHSGAPHQSVMEIWPTPGSDAPGGQFPGGAPPLPAAPLMAEPSVDGYGSGTPVQPMPAYPAEATWCAPTPTQCGGWAPPARLAAVHGFRWGDKPYWIRVGRGSASVLALVTSYCACQNRDDRVDLSPAVFSELADLSRGRVQVTVEVLAEHPADAKMRAEVRGDELYSKEER